MELDEKPTVEWLIDQIAPNKGNSPLVNLNKKRLTELIDGEVAAAKLDGWVGGVESILKPLQKHGYLTTDGQSAYATPQDIQDIIDRLAELKKEPSNG